MKPIPETLNDMDTFAARSDDATRKGAQAFARLLQLAETRDYGQIPRIARFLAATYNGHAFQLDLFELRTSTLRSATTCCAAWMPCGGAAPTCTR
jgi:hypothetical protein